MEQELVREAAHRVLAGQGIITIVRDWNRRGVPGPTPRPWGAPTLRRALLSARMAGLRKHGVDSSGKALGSLTPAVWEGALDRPTWEQLRAVLLNPERNTNLRKPTKRLLTGLIHCGACGASMLSRPRDDHTKRYVCAGRREGSPAGDRCGGSRRRRGRARAPPALEPVGSSCAHTRAGLDSRYHDLGQAVSDLALAQARLRALDDDYYVLGRLAESRYRAVQAKLEREIDRLGRLIEAATRCQVVLHPDPRAFWTTADIAQRRALVQVVVESVTILPARRGVPRFDPMRVRVRLTPALRSHALALTPD